MIKMISSTTPELKSISSAIIEELDSDYTINNPSSSPAYSLKSFVISDPDYPDAEFNVELIASICKYKDEDTGNLYFGIFSYCSLDGKNNMTDPLTTYTEDCTPESLLVELRALQDSFTFEVVNRAYDLGNALKNQDKLYHLVYQRHNSKDIYEEIVPESKLLDFNGPLKFIEEKHRDNGFSIGSANDVFYDLLQQANDLIRQDPQNTFSDYADNIKDLLDSWPVPYYLENIPLSELTAVQWLDGAGNSHLIVGNDPLRIVQDVFDEIRDADKLEIREVSRQEAKNIVERLAQAKENRRAGIGR